MKRESRARATQSPAHTGLMGSGMPTARMPACALSAMETAESLRARQLFSTIVSPRPAACAGPSRLADKVEQWLWACPSPRQVLTEAELCDSFGIGRRMARQTARVLEQRGVMIPHRGGKGAGGLRPAAPSAEQVTHALVETIHHDVSPRAVAEARHLLWPVLKGKEDALSVWLRATIDHIGNGRQPAAEPETSGSNRKSKAIAASLLSEMAGAPRQGETVHLGSLDAIAERYGTRLDVVVEAVRILEDSQKVILQRGRGGGVLGCFGSAFQAARMTNAFLASHNVPLEACRKLLEQINIGMIDLACQRGTERNLDDLNLAVAKMERARNATDVGLAWYPLQREIAALAQSPLLHVLARCLAGTLLLRRLTCADLPEGEAHELFDASMIITKNIRKGTAGLNALPHHRCQNALSASW